MPRKLQATKMRSEGGEALATLLMAFPEIGRAVFNPEKRTLSVAFICQGPLTRGAKSWLEQTWDDAMVVYARLTDVEPAVARRSWNRVGKYRAFEVERDVDTLMPGEISMWADLVKEVSPLVSTAPPEGTPEEDPGWAQKVLMQDAVEGLRTLKVKRKLVAIREGEKVLVYHG